MRKGLLRGGVTLAMAVLLTATAEGQQQSWSVSLGGGPSLPMERLGDEARGGLHGQLSVGYNPGGRPFGIRADLLLQDFRNVEREPGLYVRLGGEWFRQMGLLVNATYALPVGSVRPYGLVGVGWVRELHEDRAYWGTKHTTFGLHPGAGIELPLPRITAFVEARYLNLVGATPLPLNPPAVNREARFRSIPVTIGFRL